jgi:hypothetical protein
MERAEKTSSAASRSSPSSCSAVASTYTPPPVLIGACESKTAIPTCGRAAMFCEWRAPGLETQMNSR